MLEQERCLNVGLATSTELTVLGPVTSTNLVFQAFENFQFAVDENHLPAA